MDAHLVILSALAVVLLDTVDVHQHSVEQLGSVLVPEVANRQTQGQFKFNPNLHLRSSYQTPTGCTCTCYDDSKSKLI